MNNNKVCVLGGGGFVGRSIVNQLEKTGYAVRILTRAREHAKSMTVLPDVEIVEANIFDPADLQRCFTGMDIVINLVGILNEDKTSRVDLPTARRGDFHEIHVELPRKIVHACAASGARRLLHMSALNADPNGASAYLRSKGLGQAVVLESAMQHSEHEKWYLDGPKFVHAYGLDVTVFRPSVIFGREDSFINLFARLLKFAPVLPLASPNARFQPIFVEDVAQAFVESIANPATFGKAYDLCGPKAYSLLELVNMVNEMTGAERKIIGLPPQLSWLMAAIFEWMPGRKLMTRDNYHTMQTDSVCQGNLPEEIKLDLRAIEAVAPEYLARFDQYRGYRHAAGR